MREVENAVLLIGCQLNSADLDMYNYTKGDIAKREVTVKFSGYPVQSSKISEAAKEMMRYLLNAEAGARQIIVNSDDYNYTGTEQIAKTLKNYGANEDYYDSLTQTAESYTTSDFYLASQNDLNAGDNSGNA